MPKPSRVASSCIVGLAAAALAAGWALTAGAGSGEGPDVVVLDLEGVENYGAVGGVRAYSLGTTACNVGVEPLDWCNEAGGCGQGTTAADHPVIAQNLYRLKDGRFQQLGMSWLKHGFYSTNSPDAACGSCAVPPGGDNQLGVGCTDTYGSGLNGSRPLGRRSEVNAASGAFPYPFTAIPQATAIDQRIQVAEADLDPDLNPDSRYWMEALYLAGDDAAAGNSFNNASHREVMVGAAPDHDLTLVGPTERERPAIFAWQDADPEVEILAVDLPSTPAERFLVARRVSDLGAGSWHYEYAIHNLNSDRAARIFAVRFDVPTAIHNVGFSGIDHHSGEPYATDDWTASTALEDIVVWFTEAYGKDSDANALRWSSTFNFWFDATSPPAEEVLHLLVPFKPGTPGAVSFFFAP